MEQEERIMTDTFKRFDKIIEEVSLVTREFTPCQQAEEAAQLEIDNHKAMRENVARDSGVNK